jgi:hypothetical protein
VLKRERAFALCGLIGVERNEERSSIPDLAIQFGGLRGLFYRFRGFR